MAIIKTKVQQDLTSMVHVTPLKGLFFGGDVEGNMLGVYVTDKGQPVELTGNCRGYVILSDNSSFMIDGEIEESTAWITLPAACYSKTGVISIVIKVGTVTLAAFCGCVHKTLTETIIDPERIIPSIEELVEKIAQMEAVMEGAENVNVDMTKSGDTVTITTTNRQGVTKTNSITSVDPETVEQLADDVDELERAFTEHEEHAEDTYAKQDGYYQDMAVGTAEQLVSSKFVEDQEPYTFRASGGSADIGNRENLTAIVGGTVAWNQAVRDEASENSTDFADVVTVTDAVEDAAGVKVKIEPVQDLHGYDHPWPAGGGNNIWGGSKLAEDIGNASTAMVWDKTAKTIKIPTNSGSSVADDQIVFTNGIVFEENTVYTLITDGTAAVYLNMMFKYTDGTTDRSLGRGITIGAFSSASGKTVQNVVYRSYSGVTVLNYERCGLFKGSVSVSAYTPYSNICPITGHTAVTVTRTSAFTEIIAPSEQNVNGVRLIKNQDNSSTIVGTCTGNVSLDFYRSSWGFPSGVEAGGKYVVYIQNEIDAFEILSYKGYNPTPLLSFSTGSYGVFTIPDDATGLLVRVLAKNGVTYNVRLHVIICPYDGFASIPIALPSEAGTVYGGTLDPVAGVVRANRLYRPLVIDTTWYSVGSGSSVYYGQNNSDIANTAWAGILCNAMPTREISSITTDWGIGMYATSGGTRRIAIRPPADAGVTSVATFKEWLNSVVTAIGGDIMVSYPVAPTEITLDPITLTTLLGTNNVWADTGDLALTYTGTDEHLTLESGKKYLARVSGTDSMLLGSGQEIAAAKGTDNVFDLTQMFGTAVAGYVYGQGASFFRKWFGKKWYPYNAGELKHVEGLQSHDMVGFNAWCGTYTANTRLASYVTGSIETANGYNLTDYIKVIPGQTYYTTITDSSRSLFYDTDKAVIPQESWSFPSGGSTFTVPNNARYLRCTIMSSRINTFCISLAHNGSRNGEYEPYEKHSYPLDSTVVLRGIPKVGANGVYWDGDRYLPDGTVERRYGVVDLGTLTYNIYTHTSGRKFFYADLSNAASAIPAGRPAACSKYANYMGNANWYSDMPDKQFVSQRTGVSSNARVWIRDDSYTDRDAFKDSLSGIMLVYELATPTTEAAQPYHSTQWVSDWGTEEFVSTGIVPVGHETRYPANLRDKLQHLPDLASSNGIYIVKQTDSEMELMRLPDMPTENGNYRLKLNVASGSPTFSWEVVS